MKIRPEELMDFVSEALHTVGVPREDARTAAEVIVEGDLRGFHSHGVLRLPGYIKGIEKGAIRPEARMEEVSRGSSVVLYDAAHSLGHVVGYRATLEAVELARKHGLGMVAVRNSSHYGIAGYYTTLVAERGFVGFTTCGTEPAVAPHGGSRPVLGTNPVSIAFPRRDGPPIVVDMATSVMARGKILQALREGKEIPRDWAVGPDGEPTTDPEEALEGALLPFGGHKGYALCLALEVLAGPVVGAAAGEDVQGTTDPTVPCNKGDVFMALDLSTLVDEHEYYERLERLISQVKSAGDDVLLPGEPEFRRRKRALREGIELPEGSVRAVREVAEELGLEDPTR
ncbi:Ldh family oxidoreductase [Methanopyrus sp.]